MQTQNLSVVITQSFQQTDDIQIISTLSFIFSREEKKFTVLFSLF